MSASRWGGAFPLALHVSGRRWSLEPRRSCVQFQTHPACTWAHGEKTRNAHVLADNAGSLPKGKRLRGCFDSLAAAVFCQRLNKRPFWNKIAETTADWLLSLNILAGRHAALDMLNAETGENLCESCGKFCFELHVFCLNFKEKMCECHEKYARNATFPVKIKKKQKHLKSFPL